MAFNKITEKETANTLRADTYVLVTQTETVNGEEVHSLRRVPFATFAASMGFDVEFDEGESMLYLVNSEGTRVGLGTQIVAGISGLNMYTETVEGVVYLVIEDADGNLQLAYINEFVKAGDTAPVDYCADRIRDIILSNRKQALSAALEQELMKEK